MLSQSGDQSPIQEISYSPDRENSLDQERFVVSTVLLKK